MKKEYSEDDFYFKLGIIAPFVLALFYLAISKISWMKDICVIRKNTGYYCPGCGGSRGVQALFKGDILECIYYYPAYLYILIFYVFFMGSNILQRITKGKIQGLKIKNIYIYILLIIVLVNWIVKNVLKYKGIAVM